MYQLDLITAWIASGLNRMRGRDSERGDVPGWVMVTVMTAGLVVIIFGVFKDKITEAVSDAIDSVTSGTKN
jgi:Na+/H+ antiporter NhaD/arsenite permease-like protein